MFLRRTLGALVGILLAVPACAFTFSYGDLFEVKDVQQKNGVLLLPLTNKKYTNVKVLSKEVYSFLRQCKTDCTYPAAGTEFISTDFRRATSNERMLIAEVQFNGEMQLTVLAFKDKDDVSVKLPEVVQFKDKKLKSQVLTYVKQLAHENL